MRSEMPDPQQQTKRPKRTDAVRFLIVVLGVVVLLTVSAVMWHLPPRLSPEQVINQLGTYRFPTGNSTLQIAKDESGNVSVTVHNQTTRFYFIPHTYADPPTTFESEREWFVSVDKYQRLWVFHGHRDRSWGKLRAMPSGGTIPHAPAVLLIGEYFTPNGRLVSGYNLVSRTGDWAGVPAEFFARIPDRDSVKMGNAAAIPDSAPPLTKQQESQLTSRIRQAS